MRSAAVSGAASQRAAALVRRLARLAGGPDLLMHATATALLELAPAEAVAVLDALLRLGTQGSPDAARVCAAAVRALCLDERLAAHRDVLERLASLQGLSAAAGLFSRSAAAREYDLGAARRAEAALAPRPRERAEPLDAEQLQGPAEPRLAVGWLKQQARLTRNLDELSRLLVLSEPRVIREALLNPRLTESLVVRAAARRPVRPEPLEQIYLSVRWSVRPAVQRALAFNPYLPPALGVALLPRLGRADLLAVAADASLHATVRDAAASLSA